MAATPEKRVKDAVRKVLKRYTNYNHWPVPYGYGNSTIDALVCVAGYFVGIETKAPGEVPTERQKKILKEIQSGKFAKEWIAESEGGRHRFKDLQESGKQHQIEEVGARLRGLMPWLAKKQLVDRSKN